MNALIIFLTPLSNHIFKAPQLMINSNYNPVFPFLYSKYKLNYIHTQEYIIYSHLLPFSPHILPQLLPCSLLPFTLPQSSVFKREKKNDHLSLSTLFTLNCKVQNRLNFINTFHFSQNFLLKKENEKRKKGNMIGNTMHTGTLVIKLVLMSKFPNSLWHNKYSTDIL